jgi:copper chaperone
VHTCGSLGARVKERTQLSFFHNHNPMTIHLTVPSMACAACADTITKAVQSVDATAQVVADPKTKKVDVETVQAEGDIRAAIAASGYPVQ